MSPVLVNSSNSPAYSCTYMSSAVCMTSMSFSHVFSNARNVKPPAKAPRTAVRASSLSVQDFQIRRASPYPRTTQTDRTVEFDVASLPGGPREFVGEKCRFFADFIQEFGLRELTGYKFRQPFASVGVRRDYSPVNTLAHPCRLAVFDHE